MRDQAHDPGGGARVVDVPFVGGNAREHHRGELVVALVGKGNGEDEIGEMPHKQARILVVRQAFREGEDAGRVPNEKQIHGIPSVRKQAGIEPFPMSGPTRHSRRFQDILLQGDGMPQKLGAFRRIPRHVQHRHVVAQKLIRRADHGSHQRIFIEMLTGEQGAQHGLDSESVREENLCHSLHNLFIRRGMHEKPVQFPADVSSDELAFHREQVIERGGVIEIIPNAEDGLVPVVELVRVEPHPQVAVTERVPRERLGQFHDVVLRVAVALAKGIQFKQLAGIVFVGGCALIQISVQVRQHGRGDAHVVGHLLEIAQKMILDHLDVVVGELRTTEITLVLCREMAVPEQRELAMNPGSENVQG